MPKNNSQTPKRLKLYSLEKPFTQLLIAVLVMAFLRPSARARQIEPMGTEVSCAGPLRSGGFRADGLGFRDYRVRV